MKEYGYVRVSTKEQNVESSDAGDGDCEHSA